MGSEGSENKTPKIPPPPPNFEGEQIVQEDLSLEPREVYEAKRKKRAEDLFLRLPKKPEAPKRKVIEGKPRNSYNPQFSPAHISPVKMRDDWERATSSKGRPPIGGAQDD